MRRILTKVLAALVMWPIVTVAFVGTIMDNQDLENPWLFFKHGMMPLLMMAIILALFFWSLNTLIHGKEE